MLPRIDLAAGERVALFQRRQAAVLLALIGIVLVLAIKREEAVELHRRAGGAELQRTIWRGDVDGHLVDDRGRHLARHRTFPDELVELSLVGLEIAREL